MRNLSVGHGDDEQSGLLSASRRVRFATSPRRRSTFANCSCLPAALVGIVMGAALPLGAAFAASRTGAPSPEAAQQHAQTVYQSQLPAERTVRVELGPEYTQLEREATAVAPVVSLAPFRWILNESEAWVAAQTPHFECEDADITQAYWYRWRLFHMHMARRPEKSPGCGKAGGCWVLTEFLRKVS